MEPSEIVPAAQGSVQMFSPPQVADSSNSNEDTSMSTASSQPMGSRINMQSAQLHQHHHFSPNVEMHARAQHTQVYQPTMVVQSLDQQLVERAEAHLRENDRRLVVTEAQAQCLMAEARDRVNQLESQSFNQVHALQESLERTKHESGDQLRQAQERVLYLESQANAQVQALQDALTRTQHGTSDQIREHQLREAEATQRAQQLADRLLAMEQRLNSLEAENQSLKRELTCIHNGADNQPLQASGHPAVMPSGTSQPVQDGSVMPQGTGNPQPIAHGNGSQQASPVMPQGTGISAHNASSWD